MILCLILVNVYVTDYAQTESSLLKHVAEFKTQMEYLQKLINLISVQNLTQVWHAWHLRLLIMMSCDVWLSSQVTNHDVM